MTGRNQPTRIHLSRVALATIPLLAAGALYAGPAASSAAAAPAGAVIHGHSRTVAKAGTATFSGSRTATPGTGVQSPELVPFGENDPIGTDRSNSGRGGIPVGATSQPKSVTSSTPGLQTTFEGLNHFDNRFGSTAQGNTFSLEPPDQGLCVGSDGSGNTRVLEVLNDVLDVFDTSGNRLETPQDLNLFLGYPFSINRSTAVLGPFVTDPSCIYDAATGHWILDVLTLDTFPQIASDGTEHFTGTNHLDIAVSNTSDPTGTWSIYHIPVQDDGTQGTPDHHCSPASTPDTTDEPPTNPTACLGDYPHLGTDANGVYLTTNEYSLFGNEFHGAQVYAISKAQLTSLAPSLTVTQFDTHGMDTFGFGLNGFTLWPSQTPGGGGDPSANGTEYFLSSNAAAEAHDTGDGKSTAQPSTQLLTWAITNTGSLNTGTPDLTLSNTVLHVGVYAPPPPSDQKNGPTPLRDCLNNNKCATVLNGEPDPFTEKSYALDSNDSRMQQTTWVNGKLWGALDTSLRIASGAVAGIEWFSVAPSTASGSVTATLAGNGYAGLGNDNLTYPAIGMTSKGTGVMAFTVVGNDYYPSAGYATVTDNGVGDVHVAAAGQGPADGFSGYKYYGNPPGTDRPRWGDYGAAVGVGDNVWIASEYIGQSCSFATYQQTNFRCGNTRTALANWDTRISVVSAP